MIDTCNNVNELQTHLLSEGSQAQKSTRLHPDGSIYMTFGKRQYNRDKKQIVVARG